MKVKIKFFAIVREKTGMGEIDMEISKGTTLKMLFDELKKNYPVLKNTSSSLLFSINREYASLNSVLNDGDEIALIPPVSGG